MAEENSIDLENNDQTNVDQNTQNDQNDNSQDDSTEELSSFKGKSQDQKDADMIAKLVNERVNKELASIKSKLDKAYSQRDDALTKVADFEKREREITLKRLEEEGKHKEAYEMRLAEEKARNEALERQNMELSRDVQVRDALKSYMFRNDKAADMAFKEITSNLIRNEQGSWIHRSGISIRDYCEAFSKEEDQSFLFKPKASSGSGSTSTSKGGSQTNNGRKSLFEMSQAEVLKLAAEGKLPKNQ